MMYIYFEPPTNFLFEPPQFLFGQPKKKHKKTNLDPPPNFVLLTPPKKCWTAKKTNNNKKIGHPRKNLFGPP